MEHFTSYIIHLDRHLSSQANFLLNLDGREKLHSLSIISLEKIPRPIFAGRYLLNNLAKLLNIWQDILTLSQKRLKVFPLVDHPVCRRRKLREQATQKQTLQFFFLLTSGSFSVATFLSCLINSYPIVGKLEGARPACRRAFAWLGQILSTPLE